MRSFTSTSTRRSKRTFQIPASTQNIQVKVMLIICILYKLTRIFSDLAIARAQTPKNIAELAEEIGLQADEVSLYGNKKAKVSLSVLDRLQDQKDGNYVLCVG